MDTYFKEVIERQGEKLHPDLKRCLYDMRGMKCLKHPLVFAVPFMESIIPKYNDAYEVKKKMIEEAKEKRNWGQYIFMYERPHRIDALFSVRHDMTDGEYWETLGNVLSDTENQWQMRVYLDVLLASDRPQKEKIMEEDEREFLAKLPDEFIIYRGHQGRNKMGLSWTLSYWTANWFANRLSPKQKLVSSGICRKKDIHAVLLGRGEFEVVIHPDKLREIKPVRKLRRPAIFEHVLQLAKSNFILGRISHHGPWHWEKVERNAMALANAVKGADKMVCRLFALLHDCKRKNETEDPEHGHRAADMIAKEDSITQHLSEKRLEKLLYACRYHNDGQVSDDPTIGACWDADRLDLPRVGIIPDPKYLSTDAAKELMWKI